MKTHTDRINRIVAVLEQLGYEVTLHADLPAGVSSRFHPDEKLIEIAEPKAKAAVQALSLHLGNALHLSLNPAGSSRRKATCDQIAVAFALTVERCLPLDRGYRQLERDRIAKVKTNRKR